MKRHALFGLVTSAVLMTMSCGGSSQSAAGVGHHLSGSQSSQPHRECGTSGHRVEAVDVNNDGTPDIQHVYDGSRQVCEIGGRDYVYRGDINRFSEWYGL